MSYCLLISLSGASLIFDQLSICLSAEGKALLFLPLPCLPLSLLLLHIFNQQRHFPFVLFLFLSLSIAILFVSGRRLDFFRLRLESVLEALIE